MGRDLLTHEAARLLERTPDTVRAMERRGELPARRVGHVRLFSRADVEQLLAKRKAREKAAMVK